MARRDDIRKAMVRQWVCSADRHHLAAANAFAQARMGDEYDVWEWHPLTLADTDFADKLLRDLEIDEARHDQRGKAMSERL